MRQQQRQQQQGRETTDSQAAMGAEALMSDTAASHVGAM
jgi:hypothetical protein